MKTLEEILDILRKAKPELEAKYQITKIGVFGSYARGEQTPDSDIDIIYFCKDIAPIGIFNLVRIYDEFQTLFDIKTDPHREDNLRDEFKVEILEDTVYV